MVGRLLTRLILRPRVRRLTWSQILAGAERERLWTKVNEVWPHYDEYAKRTEREIPVVVLERV